MVLSTKESFSKVSVAAAAAVAAVVVVEVRGVTVLIEGLAEWGAAVVALAADVVVDWVVGKAVPTTTSVYVVEVVATVDVGVDVTVWDS